MKAIIRKYKKFFLKNFSKSSSGLTIIETVIALLIIGISVPLITGLQIRLLRTTTNSFALLERITTVKNMFVQADLNNWFEKNEPVRKEFPEQNVTLEYKNEGFNKFGLKNIKKETVTVKWRNLLGRNIDDKYISFFFFVKPQEAKGNNEL